MSRNTELALSKSIFMIVIATLCCSGIPFAIWAYHHRQEVNRQQETKYQIQEIIQIGPVREAIKTAHIAELLNLSKDKPQNLFRYDLKQAEIQLLKSGIIKEVKIQRHPPHSLLIDYSTREPVAFLADYTNTVIDEEGNIFPLIPYFTPKKLPKFYLGIKVAPFKYGKVSCEKMTLALKIHQIISKIDQENSLHLLSVDVSNIKHSSLGKREIVLTLEEKIMQNNYLRHLRLSIDNYEDEFYNYLNLKGMNFPKNLVIDLRMSPDAFLSEFN